MIALALAAALAATKGPDEYWVCSYLGYASKLNQPVSVKYHVLGDQFFEAFQSFEDFSKYKLVLNTPDALFATLPSLDDRKNGYRPYVSTVFIDKQSLTLIVTFQSMTDKHVDQRVGECASPIRR